MTPLDLVKAAPWDKAVFTTFALSLSFFEAVVLDALMRGNSRQAIILTDPEGLRAGLSEHGARRAGRDYEIAAVAKSQGCFHPKISAFVNGDDAHLTIGSGNLTFGGWGGNLECIDHLHPSFAADAFEDAADFFELLSVDETIKFDAKAKCDDLGASLRAAAKSGTKTGRIRLAHSLGGSIASQIADACGELGGAERLTIVSPFYDLGGGGIDDLAKLLKCDDLQLHAHPSGAVRGKGAVEWPFDSKRKVQAIVLKKDFPPDARPLHAKCLEIRCKRGVVRVSGSANGTHAGLFGRNVEASVIRLLPASKSYWSASKGEIPQRVVDEPEETEKEGDVRVGILSATLEGGRIKGRVVTPQMSGAATAALESFDETRPLGEIAIDGDGWFDFAATGVESLGFEHGRLILRVSRGPQVVEGIVSIAAATELMRRVGAMAPRIFAMLAGTETPADIAAMMAWLREDPSRWPTRAAIAGAATSGGRDEGEPVVVQLSDLAIAAATPRTHTTMGGAGTAGWQSTMAMWRASLRRPRGPLVNGPEADGDDDDEIENREKRARKDERHNRKSLEVFEGYLSDMLDPDKEGHDPLLALSCAYFLADRIRPTPARLRSWLSQIVQGIQAFDEDDDGFALSAALLYFATEERPGGAVRTRRYLQKRGVDLAAIRFDPATVPAFVDLLCDHGTVPDMVEEVREARTPFEQATAYRQAAAGAGERVGYPLLEESQHWRRLSAALDDPSDFARFRLATSLDACPRCSTHFPAAQREELRDTGVTFCCVILLNGVA